MPSSPANETSTGFVNPVVNSPNLGSGNIEYSSYNYNVRKISTIIFTVLFALLSCFHLFQAIRSRSRFLIYTFFLGGLMEMGGWAARLTSAISTEWDSTGGGFWYSNHSAFLAQICLLILAPTFIIAGCYVILGMMVSRTGYRYCRLHPKTYTILFVSGDVISFFIQAVGGGLAASANTRSQSDSGARIMVGGVIVQMVVMVAFTCLLLEFSYRYICDRPTTQLSPFAWMTKKARENGRAYVTQTSQAAPHLDARGSVEYRRVRYQLVGLAGATLFIFIRSVYRTIELFDGWNGPIISNQMLFDVLDGAMIILCLACLNVAHPVFLLTQPRSLIDDENSIPLKSRVNA